MKKIFSFIGKIDLVILEAIMLGVLIALLIISFNFSSKLMLVWLALLIGYNISDILNSKFIKGYRKMIDAALDDWKDTLELLKQVFERNKKLEAENKKLKQEVSLLRKKK